MRRSTAFGSSAVEATFLKFPALLDLERSTSPSGGDQVDGLPPASSLLRCVGSLKEYPGFGQGNLDS